MAKTNEEYWREREAANAAATKITEDEYVRQMNRRYQYMYSEIEKQIYGFYAKYARDTGLTIAEAQKAVAKMDVSAFSTKAAKYVKEKDFSKKANAELKLYNATIKINRLELLKASIGLEMIDTFNDMEALMYKGLTEAAMAELERQAGILKDTIGDNAKAARSIVGASFNNAHFSDRIWMYQRQLKNELDSLLLNGIIQGQHPDDLARHLQKRFGVSRHNAERLMRTELCRVQTDAQMLSYDNAGYDEYVYITVGAAACEICAALDGQHFKVKDMQPGVNAPPLHPNCRCSTAAWMDRETLEREVFGDEILDLPIQIGGVDCIVTNEQYAFSNGYGGVKNSENAIVYKTPEGTKFIFPAKYDNRKQQMTPEQAIDLWQKVPEAIRKRAQKTIEFVDYYNPADVYWRIQYKNFKHSYATGGDKIVFYRYDHPHNADYVVYTYCHEIGHHIDRNLIQNGGEYSLTMGWHNAMKYDTINKQTGYKPAVKGMKGLRTVSDYSSRSSVSEDFADSIALYVKDANGFSNDFPERARIIRTILDRSKESFFR